MEFIGLFLRASDFIKLQKYFLKIIPDGHAKYPQAFLSLA
jgi:hypothetical protein